MNLAFGKLDGKVYQQIESTHGNHGTLYLDTMYKHNATLQAATIANKLVLLDIFPNRKAVRTIYKANSSVNIIYATPDNEEDVASKLASLTHRTSQ